ncbi:MAG: cytochrome ubiquinol oxidase subunit I [Candidatus Hodarchaeales archaeon]|jgi:cytochrome d ubiquinol oxidase subunit I
MDAILLARLQFAFTIMFHFIFPSVTIGLAWINVWFVGKYARSNDPFDRATARFWVKLFTMTFAVGVVTGITMALQFGTNWASYSRVVGDVFGAPLAAEAILAFFLESTFLAVLIAGWDRVSKRTLWLASLMVAIGTLISAFWIVVANSWMQTPDGYRVVRDAEGNVVKAELTDFWAAVFNPSTIPRFLHTVNGALMVGAFFVLGVSAWYLLKGQNIRFAKQSFKVGLTIAFITSLLMPVIGHIHTVQVCETQPEKYATYELIEETGTGASMPIFALFDPFTEETIVRIDLPIPNALGMFFMSDPDYEFKGLEDYPEDDLPPKSLTVYPFHAMILLGVFFLAFSALGVFLLRKERILEETRFNRNYLRAAILTIPLSFLAMQLGWMAAEIGRQPWTVYQVLRTSDSISVSVPAEQILLSLIGFTIIYALLFGLWLFLLVREIQHGPKLVEGGGMEEA